MDFSRGTCSCFVLCLVIMCAVTSYQQDCNIPLLQGNKLAKFKASSFSGDNEPSLSPMSYSAAKKGWCPFKLDKERWIEVDLGSQYVVRRFDIKYHNHLIELRPIKELVFAWSETGDPGKWIDDKTPFKSKATADGLNSYLLSDVPLTAQNIRINVTDPVDDVVCLNMELYGCSGKCSQTTCTAPGYQCAVYQDGTEHCDTCLPGFLMKGVDCLARFPCDNSSLCSANAVCISHVPYEYTCVCKKNFMGDGKTCTECGSGYTDDNHGCIDVDECETDQHNCHHKQDCVNTDGSFTCKCKHGYTKSTDVANHCQDIDECDMQDACPPDKTKCINKEGYFECQCTQEGYVWYNEKCVDIDECKANLHDCDNADCTNIEGGYECQCKAGYRFKNDDLIRRECIDTNECDDEEFQRICETMDASCKNTIGSYQCVCPVGFAMDDNLKKCVDHDECKHDNPCSENAFCRNVQGGYRCTCKQGYAGDGKSCEPDLTTSQKQQTNTILKYSGIGVGVLMSIIVIMLLIKICRKKKTKSEFEEPIIIPAAFDPTIDMMDIDYDDDDEFDSSDDSDFD